MWAKLRLRERVERCGNGNEGRSGGGESHPACGDRAVPRGGGPVASGVQRGTKGDRFGGRRKELSLLQGSRSLRERDGDMAPTVQQFANMLPWDSSGGDER